mmetsp:Transcript_37514/g.87440  ORF Transcript_37514/g.87440 Transcript_37514/m.87440 type:complete len:538 (+) Transcript_37514:6674-8287(+)
MLLDQDADETLEAADDGAMQHQRAFVLAMLVHEVGIQALGQVGVDLDRAALPFAAEGVLQRVFDLGAVERAFARQVGEVAAGGLQALGEGGFGLVPAFLGADALFRPRRQLVDDVREAEVLVDLLQQRREGRDFALDLIFGAEDVAVVLREAAHAHDAVQAARGFVAVALAEFAVTQRQVAVALHALLEDQDVAGAVHRFERVVALLRLGHEHVLAILVPVPRLLPQALVQDLRALDLQVAVVAVDAAHVLLHLLPDRPALGVPEHDARRVLVDVEQVQLLAELAVVALLGFFEQRQVFLQVVLARPGRAVDALQHLVAVVTAPVGAGHLHQLEVLELARAGHVRAAAEVLEGALGVERHVLAGRDAADDLGLVVLTQGLEMRHGVVARQHAANDLLVLLGQFGHLGLDRGQVLWRERALVGEVVVEAVVDDRADRDLGFGIELLDGVGQQVGRRVADHVQAVGILVGDDGKLSVVVDHVAQVDQLAVDLATERGLGQAGADAGGDIADRQRRRVLTARAVGELDGNHGVLRFGVHQ